jgi:hypothetical protein
MQFDILYNNQHSVRVKKKKKKKKKGFPAHFK